MNVVLKINGKRFSRNSGAFRLPGSPRSQTPARRLFRYRKCLTTAGRSGLLLGLLMALNACGGGGGGGGETPTTGDSPSGPPPTPTPPTAAALAEASRLLARTSFGATWDEIESAATLGSSAWLEDQFALPASSHSAKTVEAFEAFGNDDDVDNDLLWRFAWYSTVLPATDQLRQRVAYALSQIFVVSAIVEELPSSIVALPAYYDLLANNAFGNFRTLLRDVTLSPAMGLYLSHLNNRRADPEQNTFPDQNYAREVMQLFSIGLFALNTDGSRRTTTTGDPIPTYDNDDVREFAKVFTGLSFGGANTTFGPGAERDWSAPMQMFDVEHEPGQKRLLNGVVVPDGQNGLADIDAAIDNLFNHPNVGPFIGRQLIQRLVTSNPSPAYIARVADAFNAAPRGDMKQVLRAVLLDPEATAAPNTDGAFGKLREPFLRYLALLRQLNAAPETGAIYGTSGSLVRFTTGQHVLESPSVFNFYLPTFVPSQAFGDQGLVAPEFQITTASKVIGVSNLIATALFNEPMEVISTLPAVRLDLEPLLALAGDVDALLDRIDLQFTYGTLRPEARALIRDAASVTDDPGDRVRIALYLILISPDYAIAP